MRDLFLRCRARLQKSPPPPPCPSLTRCPRKTRAPPRRRARPRADLSKVSSKLASDSKTFKWGAKKLNYLDALSKWFPCLAVLAFAGLVFVWRYYFF